ncbi:UDP-glycosyltransferase UGT5 [Drosophila biarmipes]|uniref:UDP-glycosyltransferase UGT5 n=1 Tax=Drosophila biarmipes TaxID=125945 RepID=UPI0007E699AF|nr:UDP-glycosyltransferase UGT5 [Drosophila biarmipes]XP_043950357.1 UDP-glycosyltransferase UGT5 [Drosophila biarmipes]XP_050741278.1 UDP-glycosyltransferase UGT5 [Drosophila biarmipes]
MLLLPLFLLTFSSRPEPNGAAQILGLFQHPGKSHFDFFRPMFLALAERGHNISMYSYFPLERPVANYTDFVFQGMPLLTDIVDLKNFESEWKPLGLPFKVPTFFMLNDWGLRSCRVALNSPLIAHLLESPVRYDVIILEHFSNDCMAAVAHLLKAPVIALSSCAIMPWHYKRMGSPFINPIMPMNFLPYTDEMSLIDRLNNFFHFHTVNTLYNVITQPATDALISERFGPGLPPINEIVKNTSLMLINQYYALTGPRPYAPNVIELGGLQVGPLKPLPQHLLDLLDRSPNGIIYISWGSMVNTNTLPSAKRNELFQSISQLKEYNFLMRWKGEKSLDNEKPFNLYTFDWLPQRDLLCHTKVKAFITHGGLLGTTEAVHCGVPMLVTPFYGDQFLNSGAIKQRGFGEIVDFSNFDADHITRGLRVILDKKFADNVRRSTEAFRQRPTPHFEDPLTCHMDNILSFPN